MYRPLEDAQVFYVLTDKLFPDQRQDGHNKFYVSNGVTYNNLQAALQGSCYSQMNSCQLAANAGSNRGSLTVANCEGKVSLSA